MCDEEMGSIMRTSAMLTLAAMLAMGATSASAVPMAYTQSADFFAAIGGNYQVLSFDSVPTGTVIAPGDTVGGVRFDYDFGSFTSGPNAGQPIRMVVTDGNQYGGSGPYDTTSPPNFLGTNDSDIFVDGDEFTLTFSPRTAIGMFFMTADVLFDDDIWLEAVGATASLVAADVDSTLPSGDSVYFLGIIDPTSSFSTADVRNVGGGYFFYNVDDIVLAPIPSTALLLAPAVIGLISRRRGRSL
jgi:hypothetical protein